MRVGNRQSAVAVVSDQRCRRHERIVGKRINRRKISEEKRAVDHVDIVAGGIALWQIVIESRRKLILFEFGGENIAETLFILDIFIYSFGLKI